jgi:hypothetical protein
MEAFMKSAAIVAGITVAAMFLIRSLLGKNEAAVMEAKVHELQEHFKRLDAA